MERLNVIKFNKSKIICIMTRFHKNYTSQSKDIVVEKNYLLSKNFLNLHQYLLESLCSPALARGTAQVATGEPCPPPLPVLVNFVHMIIMKGTLNSVPKAACHLGRHWIPSHITKCSRVSSRWGAKLWPLTFITGAPTSGNSPLPPTGHYLLYHSAWGKIMDTNKLKKKGTEKIMM